MRVNSLVLIIIVFLCSPLFAAQNDIREVGGYKWGDPPASGLIKAADHDGVAVYNAKEPPVVLKGIDAYAAQYVFWEDKFVGFVFNTVPKGGGYEKVKKLLFKRFGDPDISIKLKKGEPLHTWKLKAASISLVDNLPTGQAVVGITSTKYGAMMNEGNRGGGIPLPGIGQ